MCRRKYRKIYFSLTIKKELDNNETITYKLKFVDSFRFMSTSLSSLVDNLSEIYKKECKGFEEKRKIKLVCHTLLRCPKREVYNEPSFYLRWHHGCHRRGNLGF